MVPVVISSISGMHGTRPKLSSEGDLPRGKDCAEMQRAENVTDIERFSRERLLRLLLQIHKYWHSLLETLEIWTSLWRIWCTSHKVLLSTLRTLKGQMYSASQGSLTECICPSTYHLPWAYPAAESRHQADSTISPRGATQKRTEVRMPQVLPQVLPWRDEDSTARSARWLEEQGLYKDFPQTTSYKPDV